MACVVFTSASCGKDDDSIVEGLDEWVPGDPVQSGVVDFGMPRLESYQGPVFDLTWKRITRLSDTAKIEYEVWMSSDGKQTWKQFPRTSDTVMHFGKEHLDLFECNKEYYFNVAAYYWYRGQRRVFARNVNDMYFTPYIAYDNNYGVSLANNDLPKELYIHEPENVDSIKVIQCAIDSNKEITEVFSSQTAVLSKIDFMNYSSYTMTIYNKSGWDGTIKVEAYGLEGTLLVSYFKKI